MALTTGLELGRFETTWRRAVKRRYSLVPWLLGGGLWAVVGVLVIVAARIRRRRGTRPRRAALDRGWVVPPGKTSRLRSLKRRWRGRLTVTDGRHRLKALWRKRMRGQSRGVDSFGTRNLLAFGAAVVCLVAGYLVLSAGQASLAAVLLVVGYCVLFPLAIAL